jgi:hypothetical protein
LAIGLARLPNRRQDTSLPTAHRQLTVFCVVEVAEM